MRIVRGASAGSAARASFEMNTVGSRHPVHSFVFKALTSGKTGEASVSTGAACLHPLRRICGEADPHLLIC